jgi:hypothetical protein
MNRIATFSLCCLLGLAVVCHDADAYPVAFALTLDELTKEAGLVVKVKAVATRPVEDPWFEKHNGYQSVATEFEVLGVYKGELKAKRIEFRHYTESDDEQLARFYSPQQYRFEPGKPYLLWAQKPETGGDTPMCRTIWKAHRTMEDQGVILAADDVFHPEWSIKDAVWNELKGLVGSKSSKDATYALSHLDVMTNGGDSAKHDFPRVAVNAIAAEVLERSEFDLIRAALRVIGQNNPYSSNEYAAGWLATIGGGDLPGYSTWPKRTRNEGAHVHWKRIVQLIERRDARDEAVPAETIAIAVRTLGWADVEELFPHVERWTKEGDPLVRQAAIVLLADFPRQTDRRTIQALAKDPEAKVRLGAALAIGYGQFVELVPDLAKLVDDESPDTRRYAVMSLLSFSPENAREQLAARVADPQWGVLFSNALAKEDADSQKRELMRNIREARVPSDWWGGHVPWGIAWERLYKHARTLPETALKAGRYDDLLDALESPSAKNSSTEVEKGPKWYSSSEPRDLYAFYLQRGLNDRAKKFRERTKAAVAYDIEYYFKMVDENPSNYGGR